MCVGDKNGSKITQSHKELILTLLARRFNPYRIWLMLTDEAESIGLGVQTLSITVGAIYRACKKLAKNHTAEIEAYRDSYLSTLVDIRLVYKRERILDLQRIADHKNSTNGEKLQAIKEIYSQCGDEVDDYIRARLATQGAIKDADAIHNYYFIGDSNTGDSNASASLGKNLEAAFGQGNPRFRQNADKS